MAGEWIKMRNNLDSDPHVLAMKRILAVDDVDLIIGKLFRLWVYADEHTVDGFIPYADRGAVDEIARMPGLADALVCVGWLEIDGETGNAVVNAVVNAGALPGARIVRFAEHNGASAKRRAQASKRVLRSKSRRKAAVKSRGRMSKNLKKGNAVVNAGALTTALPREEKRREEKKSGEVSPETPHSAGKPPGPSGKISETLGTPSQGETAPDTSDTVPHKPAGQSRPRDELFDAVSEVTASDPKASAAFIGRVCKALRGAEPPYTAAEVRQWAEMVRAEGWLAGYPSLGLLEQRIGHVRAPPAPPRPRQTVHATETIDERLARLRGSQCPTPNGTSGSSATL